MKKYMVVEGSYFESELDVFGNYFESIEKVRDFIVDMMEEMCDYMCIENNFDFDVFVENKEWVLESDGFKSVYKLIEIN